MNSLTLDKSNKKLCGVASGISAYTGKDVILIRWMFVLGTIASLTLYVFLYLHMKDVPNDKK